LNGIDHLLSKSLDSVIRENLGKKTIQKIEKRLFEKYGLSLIGSMEQFQKIDIVLREFFGAGADGLEKKFLESICHTNSKNNGNDWFTIVEPNISQSILTSYGDDDKSIILNSAIERPLTVYEILKKSKIPQTSGYRKINGLISDGLLMVDGSLTSKDGKKISKFRSIFKNVRINIVKNKITVDVQSSPSDLTQSSIIQVVLA